MFMGFIIHFYIIFGTNLLTQSECQFLFLPCFRVSKKRKIKRSPIDMKLHGTHFWKERSPEDLECMPEDLRGGHEVGGAPRGVGRAPHSRGCLGNLLAHRRYSVGFFWSIKIIVKFQLVWTPFHIPFFCKTKKQGKK